MNRFNREVVLNMCRPGMPRDPDISLEDVDAMIRESENDIAALRTFREELEARERLPKMRSYHDLAGQV